MKVRLLPFATVREALGQPSLEIEVPEGSTLADLAGQLMTEHPGLQALWPRLAVAVNGELVDSQTVLEEGCEVALLPPVSGGAPGRRTDLVDEAIDLDALTAEITDTACGAVLLFLGTVRDHHHGRGVDRIRYDAYRPMALKALETIVTDLESRSPGLRVGIVHRIGVVPVGEVSVAIAVASPHRELAYAASREALERLKREAPIWKQERYEDGEVMWREEEPLALHEP
jgi:molybdopterin synthase catalytic subunit